MTALADEVIDLTAYPEPPLLQTRERSTARRVSAAALLGVGALALALLTFLFVGSNVVYERSQRLLLHRFRSLTQEGQASELAWRPPVGAPIAVLSIPAIGVQTVIVEGTTPSDTMSGPGHYPASSLPGRFGNSVVMGRRSTYGAPFRDLQLLRPGDRISLATGVGLFMYAVDEVTTVAPGRPDVIGPSFDARLTLVTSDPPYRGTGRLAIVARLQGDPAADPPHPPGVAAPVEGGLQADEAALGPLLFWGELLIVGIVGAVWLGRQSSGRVGWLLGTPIVVALAWAVFVAASRLLPATL